MAATFTPAGGGSVAYADTGSYASNGQWIEGTVDSTMVGPPKRGYSFPTSAGVDGAGSTLFGMRTQEIQLKVVYVAASAAAVASAIDADQETLAKQKCSLSLDGIIYPRCFLEDFTRGQIKETKRSSKYFAKVIIRTINRGL